MARWAGWMGRLLAALLLATPAAGPSPAALAADEATPEAGVVTLPEPTGPYAVGRALFEWVDDSRGDPFAIEDGGPRELVVWLWYPAEAAGDAEAAPYLPDGWAEEIGRLRRFDPKLIRSHAIAGAPVASDGGPFPVLVLSPGNAAGPGSYTALAEELASHGYVVAGVNHTFNAAVTVFEDGRVVPGSPFGQLPPGSLAIQAKAAERLTRVHAADVGFVLDRLEALNEEPGEFAGRLDLARVGIFGHSLGGATAAAVCRVDRRCAAGANLDGGVWGRAAESGVPVPFLLLESDHLSCAEQATLRIDTLAHCEEVEARFEAGWRTIAATARPGYWLTVEGSRHGSFTDAPFLAEAGAEVGPLLAGTTVAPERMWRVTSDVLLAFFDAYVKGGAQPLLAGSSPAYPEVVRGTPAE